MRNVLSFDVAARAGDNAIVVTPHVDGTSFSQIVKKFEEVSDMSDPAGGYGGLIPEFFRFGALDRYFLGDPEKPYFGDTPSRVFLLGCECGEVGCWPLTGRITAHEREVVWDNFMQPHRPQRLYSGFGPFLFDREQYEQALQKLPA